MCFMSLDDLTVRKKKNTSWLKLESAASSRPLTESADKERSNDAQVAQNDNTTLS